jgi:hypothetical protein
MARYALPFGYIDWPEPDGRPRSTPTLDDAELEPLSRVTLRVPAGLKRRVEASAALEGVPADAWIVRSLSRSVDPRLGIG